MSKAIDYWTNRYEPESPASPILGPYVVKHANGSKTYHSPSPPKHLCGASGFGAMGDTCPGCERRRLLDLV